MAFSGEHGEYYLVVFDDHHGNMDTEGKLENGIVKFLKDNRFICKGGFYGMSLYWVDISHKFYIPGRPGVTFGKIVDDYSITFEEFKVIYNNYKKRSTTNH